MTRNFNEREVALILKKAATPRHEGAFVGDALGEGLSLAEILDIASVVGIDPARVEEAAHEVLSPARRSALHLFTGAPSVVRSETALPIQLTDETRAEIVRTIRAGLGKHGVVGGDATNLEWTHEDDLGSRHFTMSATAEGTRVDVFADFGSGARGAVAAGAAMAAVGGIGALVAFSVGSLGWLVAPAAVFATIAVPRLTLGRLIQRETRKLAAVTRRLRSLGAADPEDVPTIEQVSPDD